VGVAFEAVTPDVDELTEGAPEEAVIENARRKAVAGIELTAGEGNVVLGVDTEVVLDRQLLGKAGDEDEARERLEALSGRTHEVLGGVVLLASEGSRLSFAPAEGAKPGLGGEGSLSVPPAGERTGVERSLVTFRELPEPLLDAYLASGEWRDRAGAYAVQGLGSALVDRIEGDLSNVIGLPVNLLLDLLPDLLDNAGDSRCSRALRANPQVQVEIRNRPSFLR
jgi:septum formation protein